MSDLACAQDVLQTEINGLSLLKDGLDESFPRVIDAVVAMKQRPGGRLIVAGIGKSGHVARKMAATLASTGTPAYFVHPGEASHGDLGMVTQHDVVLMLSNSGENPELSDLIHYTRRYEITLIAMTSKADSTLAKYSDITLLLPRAPEACPDVLAPTTSTTMMMALGDAIAIALLKRMNLTPEDFKVFHPGGKLGQQLQKVEDLMIPYAKIARVPSDALMEQVVLELSAKNQGCVVVADSPDQLCGLVTDGDLKRHMGADLLSRPAVDIMTRSPKTIAPNKLAGEALNMMTKESGHYITSLLVCSAEGTVLGLLRLQDCLQAGVS